MSPHAHGKVGMLKNDYSCRVALETKIRGIHTKPEEQGTVAGSRDLESRVCAVSDDQPAFASCQTLFGSANDKVRAVT